MRHFTRLSRDLFVLCCVLIGLSSTARAVPVYLAPDSLFPSGHYNREWLKQRTTTKVRQRWLKVRARTGVLGWVPEDYVLTRLLLSSHARAQTNLTLRLEPKEEGRRVGSLGTGQRVRLLGRTGQWFEVQAEGTTLTGFVAGEFLRPDPNTTPLAYAKERTAVLSGIQVKSETLASVLPGERLEVLRVPPASSPDAAWILARKRDRVGFVKRAHIILRDDLPTNSVLSLRSSLPLRRESVPFADLNGQASYLETLAVVDSRMEEWGHVALREEGEVWWPMNERFLEPGETAPRPFTVTTAELFRRKIFDMASASGTGPGETATSNATPKTLQIASADGIFRTTDGRQWQRIDQFRDRNYPLAITPGGRIFVGPFVSDDDGASFREYIRWDNLVNTIRAAWEPNEHNLRILEVKSADASGTHIELALDIGEKGKIRVTSRDDGRTWSTL